MMKKKKIHLFSYFIWFCYFCNCQAADHTSFLKIVLFRGPICSIVLNTDVVFNAISVEEASALIGAGANVFYIGSLHFWVYNDEPTIPYTLELLSTTYDPIALNYIAKNGVASIVIQIKRNFDNNGNKTLFTPINPITNPIILRQSNTRIFEYHSFKFYIHEDPSNIFFDGAYTANFRLYFASP